MKASSSNKFTLHTTFEYFTQLHDITTKELIILYYMFNVNNIEYQQHQSLYY